ncbi:MAG TPA: T9SS type A sorting domain-containing protein, partial [Tangfeifania sp.]|nr:T9SS type A sorting domain-containing protein [Tangfeifania sp.]
NPVNDVLSISFFEQFSLKVFNSVGQIIYTENNIFEGADIDTQTWESGLYIIAIMKNNKTEFRKIIKK